MTLPRRRPAEDMRSWLRRLEIARIEGLAEHHEHVANILDKSNGAELTTTMKAEVRAQRAAAQEFRKVLQEMEDATHDDI